VISSSFIPWRVKAFVSDKFPLFYHFASHIGKRGNSPDFWDRWLAETWNDERRVWPTKNKLIETMTSRSERILDVACGNGSILRYLLKAGYNDLHGLELSRYAVETLSREGISMHLGNLPVISLPDAELDVVIASQILEHIVRRRKFVREIHRVLRPGGRAFIFVPDDCLGPIDEDNHVIKYNQYSLKTFLQRYFEVIQIESVRDVNHGTPVLFALVQKVEGARQGAGNHRTSRSAHG
jgi:SAM-dependent methyltransferase